MAWWEGRFKTIAAGVGTAIVPLFVAFIAGYFARSTTERGVQARFVELAIEILKGTPTAQERALRGWAVDVLDVYSGVPLSAQAKADLIESVRIPEVAARGGGVGGYQGEIPVGSTVQVTFALDSSAAGPAHVFVVNDSREGGSPTARAEVAAPGKSVTIDLGRTRAGLLLMSFDMSSHADRARVSIVVDGVVMSSSLVVGDEQSTFSVRNTGTRRQ